MTLISVPDMSCGHCKASVTEALTALPGATSVSVDLTLRRVEVKGAADPESMLIALLEIGFPAQIIAKT
ncbi:heavy metal transport/detoxification protein [Cypionkella aquatica]|uniref:Heavy metal transport/detoxification protein n=1 Tax=Cypionkella aquatica TaxID=1756042 RepID=A0AA37X0Y7_9RHOB|nr:heavy-metal-associated domain-containing protein [Cypionkella aquatica]GLS87602.1 heavy metal transport/detoxification protein [Cypionkella aquatica]